MPKNSNNSKRKTTTNPSDYRIWNTDKPEEVEMLSDFLGVCTWKLTSAEMREFSQDDIKKVFSAITEKKITIEQIKTMSSEELYDLIAGQLRMF